jgi:hypothetical protein
MKDLLLDTNGDLVVENGDLVISNSDRQNIEQLTLLNKGEYKEFPLLGFGAVRYIGTTISKIEFKRDLKLQLEYDGYNNPVIDLTEGFENLKIEI